MLSARPFSDPSSAAFSPNNDELAIKFTNGRIVVIGLPDGRLLRDYKNQKEGEGSEILFSPDGTQIVHGTWKGLLAIREVHGEKTTGEEFDGEMIDHLSTDSRKRFWLAEHRKIVKPGQNWPDYDYLALHRWPLFRLKPKIYALDVYTESATISPDGTRVCLLCRRRGEKKKVRVLRISDGTLTAHSADYENGGSGNEIAWSRDSSVIGVVQKMRFVFYRASDLEMLAELPCRYPSSICFLPNQDLVVLGTWNASVLASVADVLMGKVKLK